jgi:hypothetical protein
MGERVVQPSWRANGRAVKAQEVTMRDLLHAACNPERSRQPSRHGRSATRVNTNQKRDNPEGYLIPGKLCGGSRPKPGKRESEAG